MYLHPFNRHLLIDLVVEVESENDSCMVLLPEEYQKKLDKFAVAEVVEISDDCSLNLMEGDFIVVDRSMVEELKLKEETFNLVLENYVYGRIDNNDEENDSDNE